MPFKFLGAKSAFMTKTCSSRHFFSKIVCLYLNFSAWGYYNYGCPDRVDIVKDINKTSKEPCGGEKYTNNLIELVWPQWRNFKERSQKIKCPLQWGVVSEFSEHTENLSIAKSLACTKASAHKWYQMNEKKSFWHSLFNLAHYRCDITYFYILIHLVLMLLQTGL